jgi:hypothetical protein
MGYFSESDDDDLKPVKLSTLFSEFNDDSDWPRWFFMLRMHAQKEDVWHLVDPDGSDAPFPPFKEPARPPKRDEVAAELRESRRQSYLADLRAWEETAEAARGPRPVEPGEPDPDEVSSKHQRNYELYADERFHWNLDDIRYAAVLNWVDETISNELIRRTFGFSRFHPARMAGLQALIRVMRDWFTPRLTSDEIIAFRERERAREVEEAKRCLEIEKQNDRRKEEKLRRRLEGDDQRKRHRGRRRRGRRGGRARRGTAG